MARLTNEQIWNMSLAEADRYTKAHPAEAWRFAKIHWKSALQQSRKAAGYGLSAGYLHVERKRLNPVEG